MSRIGWALRIPVFLFAIGMWVVPALSAETCNRVVAVVNNEVITQYELETKIKEMTGFPSDDLKRKEPGGFNETRRRILDLLIDEKISEEKIKELNIQVTQRQVDATIQRLKDQNRLSHEDFVAQLEKQGFTYEKFQGKVRKDLLRMQLVELEVRSKIIVREEAIKQYYEQHKKDFGYAEKVRLAGIFLMRKRLGDPGELSELQKRGEEILGSVRAGEDFGELAKRFSDGPGAAEGGDLGVFNGDQLEPQIRKIIDMLPEGSVSGLIPRKDGMQILKVVQKQYGATKPLEEVREAIYSILYQEEVDRRYESWIKGLRESSYTRILVETL